SLAGVIQTNSSVENLTARPDVVFRNNTARNNRGRGILMTSGGKVVIENNLFERPSMMGVLVDGDNEFWYESGGVEDVTIRSNRFVGLSPSAPMFRLGPTQPGEKWVLPPYHYNIRILDNIIESVSPVVVDASRVSGLEFSGNTVQLPLNSKSPAVAFLLNACEGVVLRGNKFSQPALIQSKQPGTPILLEKNENLSLK
ncbi:MAG: right-handed parallel beta-helix repeat-containing protein, partial [Verrucomicrobia bacterium]|nr:right-handed parallel beta-helix repeat-containing protein [Verrucomicrobiota bacterium]